MADYGLKVSGIGDSAIDAELTELVMSSKYPTPKIKIGKLPEHFGSGQYTVVSSAVKVTVLAVPHGYDYVPTVLCLVSPGGRGFSVAPTLWFSEGPSINAYCDSTHFRLEITAPTTNAVGQVLKYKYYILDRNGT